MEVYKILHVEDDPKDAELVALALSDEAWKPEISCVTTKERFEEALHKSKFDVVLLDFSVTDIDPVEMLRSIKKKNKNLPAIIVSGAIGDKKAVEALESGATDYVLKDKLYALPGVVVRAVEEARTKKEREEIKLSYKKFSETSPVGFYEMDADGNCIYINDGLAKMLGLSGKDYGKSGWLERVHEDDRGRVDKAWKDAYAEKSDFEVETRLIRKDGSTVWVLSQSKPEKSEGGGFSGYIGTVFDISRLKETEFRLQELSYYDTLTKLPNRRFFQESLHKCLLNAKRYDEKFALFYIDLDEFKKINDTKGHNFGDRFLEEVGKRFQIVLRESDFIARIGGDEFAIIMEKYPTENDIVIMADRILEALKQPYEIEGEVVHSSVSIGIATYPEAGESSEVLLQHSDLAMYRAKSSGKDKFQFYSSRVQEKLDEQVKIENLLRDAVENDEFSLVYQPQIYAKDKTMAGYEVLLRWNSSILGMVSPAVFIPIAETSGYMDEIGMWVFRKSLEQHKKWELEFGKDIFSGIVASINVSPAQILRKGVSREFIKEINSYDLAPGSVMIEVTETTYMHNPDLLREVLDEIKAFGASIAVDDFGTGYSSLNIIEKLPINFLKIDTNFVRNMFNDKHNLAIIKAVTALSKGLSFEVVAEGVETKQQADALTKIGCDYLQGYYYGRPMEAQKMREYIAEMTKNKCSRTG